MGLMIGVELSVPGQPIVEGCIRNGLLINCTHDKILRIMPALNVTGTQIHRAVEILDTVLGGLTPVEKMKEEVL